MNPIVFLLVCEGQSDVLVINEIAKKISAQIGKQILIREIAPVRDATTNRYPNHGWEEVRQWCRLYGKSSRISAGTFEALAAKKRNWRALMGFGNVAGLIIQMDTDIAQYIYDLPARYSGGTKSARKNYCRNAILNWLEEPTTPSEMHFILSTYSTETWLLATHHRAESIFSDLIADFDYEDIENVEDRLLALGYLSHSVEGKNRLIKHENVYIDYAKKIAHELDVVRRECDEAELFTHKLEIL